MSKKKLALDAQSHLELLVRLFNIEEVLENGMYGEASKELTSLIEDVRFSEVIESYELMEDTDRDETIQKEIEDSIVEEWRRDNE